MVSKQDLLEHLNEPNKLKLLQKKIVQAEKSAAAPSGEIPE